MPEFRGYDLRTAREQAGLRLWQVAQGIHTSESCIRRWEGDEAEPSPEVIDQIEEMYKCPMMWHRWMLSHSDSYRRHYSPISDTTTIGSVLRNRYEIEDILRLQEAIECDVSDDGKIDNMMSRDKYVELIKKAVACLSDTLARIEKRSGAK